MCISVVMAVYNGEKYIREQLNSILPQLNLDDEIVISVDPSSDNTNKILNDYMEKYCQIKVFEGKGQGLIKNFENAISKASNEYIFLCDQDDVWLPNKVETILSVFEKEACDLVLHDAKIVDENLNIIENSFMCQRKSNGNYLKNIIKNSFIGCCMAFKKDFKKTILPFPKDIPMHDQFIGLLALKKGKVVLLKRPLLLYRRHDNNASDEKHANFMQMIKWRINILKSVVKRVKDLNQ